MKKTDIAYLAGVFDGEGSISIEHSCKGKYHSLNCYVKMAGSYMPFTFQMGFGGSVRKYHEKDYAGTEKEKEFDYWSWQIASKKAMAFLKVILPYLRLKKPQAEIAIVFQERKTSSKHGQGNRLTDADKALSEAERLLMQNLKKETYRR